MFKILAIFVNVKILKIFDPSLNIFYCTKKPFYELIPRNVVILHFNKFQLTSGKLFVYPFFYLIVSKIYVKQSRKRFIFAVILSGLIF